MNEELTLARLHADAHALLEEWQQSHPDEVIPDHVLREIVFAVAPLLTAAEVRYLAATDPQLPSPDGVPLPTIISEIFAQLTHALQMKARTDCHRAIA